MKAKKFDAVELQHRGGERVRELTSGMTLEQQLQFWRERHLALKQRQAEARAKRPRNGEKVPLKITYDADADVLSIVFRHSAIERSDEEKPGIVFDYDEDGNIVGIEILDASKRMENPMALEYAVTR